jgi:hypothetical protein
LQSGGFGSFNVQFDEIDGLTVEYIVKGNDRDFGPSDL